MNKSIVELIKQLLSLFTGGFIYNQGKKSQKLKNAQAELEALEDVKDIKMRIDNDPVFRNRVRGRFDRK